MSSTGSNSKRRRHTFEDIEEEEEESEIATGANTAAAAGANDAAGTNDGASPRGPAARKKRRKKRSPIWDHFLLYDDPATCIEMAKCNYCTKVLSADSELNGTSSVNNHLKRGWVRFDEFLTWLKA